MCHPRTVNLLVLLLLTSFGCNREASRGPFAPDTAGGRASDTGGDGTRETAEIDTADGETADTFPEDTATGDTSGEPQAMLLLSSDAAFAFEGLGLPGLVVDVDGDEQDDVVGKANGSPDMWLALFPGPSLNVASEPILLGQEGSISVLDWQGEISCFMVDQGCDIVGSDGIDPVLYRISAEGLTATLSGTGRGTLRNDAIEDWNGDGVGELLVGTVEYGSDMWVVDGARFVGTSTLDDAALALLDLETEGALADVGDVNGDGIADVAASQLAEDAGEGAVLLFDGPLEGYVVTAEAAARIGGGERSPVFGGHVRGGDLDGDGYDDLVVGNLWYPERTIDGACNVPSGALFTFHGPLDGDVEALASRRAVVMAETVNFMGSSLSVGDLTGDGRADIVAGSASLYPYEHHAFVWQGAPRGSLGEDDAYAIVSADYAADGAFGQHVLTGDVDGAGTRTCSSTTASTTPRI